MWFFLNNLTVFESPPERRRPGQRLHLERDSPGPNPKWWRLKTCKRGLCTVVESNKFPSSVSWTELYQIVRWVPISQGHLRHPHLATALLPNLHLPTGTCKNHQKPVSKTGFFPTGFPHFVTPAVLKCNFNQFYHIWICLGPTLWRVSSSNFPLVLLRSSICASSLGMIGKASSIGSQEWKQSYRIIYNYIIYSTYSEHIISISEHIGTSSGRTSAGSGADVSRSTATESPIVAAIIPMDATCPGCKYRSCHSSLCTKQTAECRLLHSPTCAKINWNCINTSIRDETERRTLQQPELQAGSFHANAKNSGTTGVVCSKLTELASWIYLPLFHLSKNRFLLLRVIMTQLNAIDWNTMYLMSGIRLYSHCKKV